MPWQRASLPAKGTHEKGTHDRMADVIENNAKYWVKFTPPVNYPLMNSERMYY